jgi:hypothetical protein
MLKRVYSKTLLRPSIGLRTEGTLKMMVVRETLRESKFTEGTLRHCFDVECTLSNYLLSFHQLEIQTTIELTNI